MSSILSTAKPPKSNLSRQLQKAVKNLREDRDIVILPADKGNATVILDQTDYAAKMEHLDSTWRTEHTGKCSGTLQAELKQKFPLL